jgi:ABC-2 type transport system ATP-binding protein
MTAIKIEHLTKKYGTNQGIFDISFDIHEGEVFGFLGPNGAGKTTTIRHLLGFIKPHSGKASIMGKDSWEQSKQVQKHLGYLPAEIAFPANSTGTELIHYVAKMRGLSNLNKANQLIERFNFDPSTQIKRMSKEMKQKVGIVCAFMHDPQVLILDEPTTGLDPLMQSVFVELIQEEKKKGTSILMSSHLFEEIDGTCDRIGMIKSGKIISIMVSHQYRQLDKACFQIEFIDRQDFENFTKSEFVLKETIEDQLAIIVEIDETQINELLLALSQRKVKTIREVKSTLEQYFMEFYKGEKNDVQ